MIYTVTLNPSLDSFVDCPSFEKGRLNRTQNERVVAGGKGINVSQVLKNLGMDSVAMGFLAGEVGKCIQDMLENAGIQTKFTFDQSGQSRINLKLRGEEETEINGSGPFISDTAKSAFFSGLSQIRSGDYFVISGRGAGGIDTSFYLSLLHEAKEKKARVVLDISGESIDLIRNEPVFLLKPNRQEAEEILHRPIRSIEEAGRAALQLQEMGAEYVLLSLGADGAILALKDKTYLHQNAYDGKVIHTIGCGDSMLAGFLYCLENGQSIQDAFSFSLAAGCACAFYEDLPTKEEILKLLH